MLRYVRSCKRVVKATPPKTILSVNVNRLGVKSSSCATIKKKLSPTLSRQRPTVSGLFNNGNQGSPRPSIRNDDKKVLSPRAG